MPIALVSHATAGGLASATTAAINTTGASLLVITAGYSAAPTISDSKGNTWVALTIRTNGFSGRIFYAWNPIVGTNHTFTAAAAVSAVGFVVAAYSGVETASNPYDVESGGTGTAVTQAGIGGATLTPSTNDSLIVAGAAFDTAVTGITAAAGFAIVNSINFTGGSNYGADQEYLVQTTAAAITGATVTQSWTTNSGVSVVSAVFKAAGGGGGALTAGTAALSSTTATTINVSAGAASGGTAPLTYQWYRSTTANFVPGAGNILAGATALTRADIASLSADTPYYYKCRVTDDVGATADTNQIAGALKAATLIVGFIGDSITFGFGLGAGLDPVSQIATILKKTYKNRAVTAVNSAVSGSRTAQWVTGQSNLTTAKAAFAAALVTHVHIMLGANDAAAATLVSAATYKANLENIIADLTGAGYTIILSYPTYIPAGANSNATTAASVALAQSYQAQIDSLIDGVEVLRGDTLAYNYFIANLAEYQADMTHPTAAGAVALATMWARAIDRSLLEVSSGGELIPNSLYYSDGRFRRSASGATIPGAGRLKIG